jgi:hypothetical protein
MAWMKGREGSTGPQLINQKRQRTATVADAGFLFPR